MTPGASKAARANESGGSALVDPPCEPPAGKFKYSNSAFESAQRSDHPWQARQQGGGWTINQYRPSRSVHPPWRPASPPGVTNPFLSPRSVPKVRVSAERRCATEPRARAKVSSNGVELVLACAPKPAENAVPAQGRPGRTARSGSRDIANDRRLAAWPACASDADDGVAFRQANRHVWLVDANESGVPSH